MLILPRRVNYPSASHVFLYLLSSIFLFLTVCSEKGEGISRETSLNCYFPREYYATSRKATFFKRAWEAPKAGNNYSSSSFLHFFPPRKVFGLHSESFDNEEEEEVNGCLTGRGVDITLLDSGLEAGFLAASRNILFCRSFIDNLSCTDPGYEHGTRSASLLAGNICLSLHRSARWNPSGNAKEEEEHTTCELLASVLPSLAARMNFPGPPKFSQLNSTGEKGDGGVCYFGMAPNARLRMLRVFDQDGQAQLPAILAALRYLRGEVARVPNIHQVLCLSLGRESWTANEAIAREIRELTDAGVVVVAAAGNEGGGLANVLSPGDLPEVLTVGSIARKISFAREWNTNRTPAGDPWTHRVQPNEDHLRGGKEGMVSAFSSRGPTTAELPFGAGRVKPEVVAVGERVCALEAVQITQRTREFPPNPHSILKSVKNIQKGASLSAFNNLNGKNSLDFVGKPLVDSWTLVNNRTGTSVAAALVAGVVALCLEAFQQEKEKQKQENPSLSCTRQDFPEKPNIAFIKEVFIKTARRLTPSIVTKDQKEEDKAAWFFAKRQNDSSFAFPSSIYAGDALLRTYSHYLYVLQYSMIAQGAGEFQPARALDLIKSQAKRLICKVDTKISQNEEESGECAHDHPHDDHSNDHERGFLARKRKALDGWVVFPPQINAKIHNFRVCGGPKIIANCLYHWPYCEQPLYLGAAPKLFNLTLHITSCANATLVQPPGNKSNDEKNGNKEAKVGVGNGDFRSRVNSESEEALARRGWRYEIDHVVGFRAPDGRFNEPFHFEKGRANNTNVDEKKKPDCFEAFSLDRSALGSASLAIPALDIQVHATRSLHAHTGTISVMIQTYLSHVDKGNRKGKNTTILKEEDNIFRTRRGQTRSFLSNPYEQLDIYGRIVLVYSCRSEHSMSSSKVQTPFICHNITVPFAVSVKTRSPPRLQRVIIDASHSWLNPLDDDSSIFSAFPSANLVSTAVPANKAGKNYSTPPPRYRANTKPSVNHSHANLALLYLFLTRELGFYVDFFSIFTPQPYFLSNDSEFENKGGVDWRGDYLASVGTLLVVHQSLPVLPAIRHRLNAAIRPDALRKGLNVIFITDWINPSATITAHSFRSSGKTNKTESRNSEKEGAASSGFVGSPCCALICEEVNGRPNGLSGLCSIAMAAKLCEVNRSVKGSFQTSSASSTGECAGRYSSLRNSQLLSINRWFSELINHGVQGGVGPNRSNMRDYQEKRESVPRAIVPQLSEVGVRHGFWMVSSDSHQLFHSGRSGRVKNDLKNQVGASHMWRSVGEFHAGGSLHLVEQPITNGKVLDRVVKLPQPAGYDLLLCGGYDPWKASRRQEQVGESSIKENVSSSSYCSPSQGFIAKVKRLFTQLLQVYVAHHVDFADLHDESFSFFDPQNDLIRRLYVSEGVQSSTCMELVKELLYALLTKNWEWFSASDPNNSAQGRETSVENQSKVNPPPCSVAVGMLGRTFVGEEPLEKGKRKKKDDPPCEGFELEEYQLLLNFPPYKMQVGFLVNLMLKQSPFVLPKQASRVDEASSCNDVAVFLGLKAETPREGLLQCTSLNSSMELEGIRKEELQLFQHLGAHYHGNHTGSLLSSARMPGQRCHTHIYKGLSLITYSERNEIWWSYLKRNLEKSIFNTMHSVKAFLVEVFTFLIVGGLFYVVVRR